MLPWRHSPAWWAFTCWACHFVAFEKAKESEEQSEGASDDLQEVWHRDAPLASAHGIPIVRMPKLRVRRDRPRGRQQSNN
jgi:hypothetical protein